MKGLGLSVKIVQMDSGGGIRSSRKWRVLLLASLLLWCFDGIAPLQVQAERIPYESPPSEFELYVAGTVEITETQAGILANQDGVSILSVRPHPADGRSVVPLRVRNEKGVILRVGYLVGAEEALYRAFRILGIPSRFAVVADLGQFGYELFRKIPTSFDAVEKVPVGPDYIVGPGDEVRISVWGKFEAEATAVVDRDGKISLPKIGVIGVAGLTFRELKETVRQEISKYYTGFEMNVSLGALRTITVYLVGDAVSPGAYSVSSLSTLVSALFTSGGPARTGSMRDIQLRRGSEIVTRFDLYDLLLKGDKTRDARILPGDVIFIPPVGPLVAVAGSVQRPAIYELKGETSLDELLDMAGGLTPVASTARLRVERVVENTRKVVFDSNLPAARKGFGGLKSGDILTLYPVVEDLRVVHVRGAVQREGEYGFTPGMSVRDLVLLAGGLKYYAYRREAELTRVTVTNAGPRTEMVAVPLEKALDGEAERDLTLRENDSLFVRAIPEWNLYRSVVVSGEFLYPGTYTIRKGERLSSLIRRAGGFTDKAYRKGAVFTRERVRVLQQARIDEMVERLERELAGKSAADTVSATGTEEARLREEETRMAEAFLQNLRQAKAKGRMVVSLTDTPELAGTPSDIELEDGDSVYVPADPGSIQVAGSVFNQTAFVYDARRTMADYVALAGGYTKNADRKRVYILKVDGSAVRPGDGILSGISWSREASRWESGSVHMDPGDTIVVPEKLERIAWLREIKDITQILYQVAVTAGVLIVAF